MFSSSNLKLSIDSFDVHFRSDFTENRAREKEKNQLCHHHVISMVCTLIEHPPISEREIAQLLKKKNPFGSRPLLRRNIFSEVKGKVVWTFWQKTRGTPAWSEISDKFASHYGVKHSFNIMT